MSIRQATATARLGTAVTLVIGLWALLVAAQWELAESDMTALAHGHAVAVVDGFDRVSGVVEHAHIDATTHSTPEAFSDEAVVRGRTALAPLWTVVAAVLLGCFWSYLAVAPGRDPPRRYAFDVPGRQLLTRLCIARC